MSVPHRSSRTRLDTTFYNTTINTHNFNGEHKGNITQTYKKIRTVGSGSYGTVILVKNIYTNADYACKCLPKNKFKAGEIDKFKLEIELIRRCDHPNIVKIFEYYEDETHFYIIEEACDGGELFDYITGSNFYGEDVNNAQKTSMFLEKNAAQIMHQVLNGINYLHSRGIVHRDLKPENILLKHKNDLTHLKIIDFGLSSKMTVDPTSTLKDQVGTPYYIAPEVIEKNYDEKCDIWSCGVILYILVSGQAPFNGPDDLSIIKKVKSRVYSMSGKYWSHITPECKNLIKKMIISPSSVRLTAAECLDHPWFSQTMKKKTMDLLLERGISKEDLLETSNQIKNRLVNFISANKFHNIIKLCCSYRTDRDKHIKNYMKIFERIDLDNNGLIDEHEFMKAYSIINTSANALEADEENKQAYELFKNIDLNGDGFIEISEWLAFVIDDQIMLTKEKLCDAFHAFDTNGDGLLNGDELKNVLHDDNLVEIAFKKFEGQKENGLTFEQFCDLIYNGTV